MASTPLLRMSVLLLLAAGGLPAQETVEVGSTVPPLSGEDVRGHELSWTAFEDKVVLVYFHSDQMAYSKQGLSELLEALAKDRNLASEVAILLVGTGEVDPVATLKAFDAAQVTGRIVADPDRSRFAAYHVVAFPTVFTVGTDRALRDVTKGFGPLMADKVVLGARLAAGLIDEQAYHRALEARPESDRSADRLRVARTVRMVRQLVAAGMLDQARESMLRVVDAETENAEAIGLLARILLQQDRVDQARPWLERLKELTPASVELRRLEAHLALLLGRPDEALQILEQVTGSDPETALLRGKAWEAKGDMAKAAALYRQALETVLRERA